MIEIKNAIEREKEEADRYQSEYDNNFNNPKVSDSWRESQADEAEYHQTISEWLEDYAKCKNAWEEVLQELERQKALAENKQYTGLLESTVYGNCINIINQKLNEITEEEEYER